MAQKPLRPCKVAGCRSLTRDSYCTQHEHIAAQQRKQRHQYYDRYQRDKEADAFYHSIEWEAARQEALIRDYGLCQHCLRNKRITVADMVHHKQTLRTHWHLRVTLSNLVSLCNTCHGMIDHTKL